jgi:hypothetical protein
MPVAAMQIPLPHQSRTKRSTPRTSLAGRSIATCFPSNKMGRSGKHPYLEIALMLIRYDLNLNYQS